ncbi:MAG TPA: hypothetical protein VJQ77_08240, partial [Novosphingobium sp.]|nr:hypothetical protein [Novosphingobium sp.]
LCPLPKSELHPCERCRVFRKLRIIKRLRTPKLHAAWMPVRQGNERFKEPGKQLPRAVWQIKPL